MDTFIFILFNFLLYSFIGWIIENLYSYIITGEFKKDGFMKGPYKPMYGIAFTLLVIVNKYSNINSSLLIVLYFIIPTLIEFISGYLLRRFFNKEYWDYSNLKYNYKGLISLRFSFYWMILSFIGIIFIQPIINAIFINYMRIWGIIAILGCIIMAFDLVLTIRTTNNKLIVN
ncbi:putative ABC transporter permease [Clostridium carnis]